MKAKQKMRFVERFQYDKSSQVVYYVTGWMPADNAEEWTNVYVEIAKDVLKNIGKKADYYDKTKAIEYAIFISEIRTCGISNCEDNTKSYRDTFRGVDGKYWSANKCQDYARYIYELATFEPKEMDLVF